MSTPLKTKISAPGSYRFEAFHSGDDGLCLADLSLSHHLTGLVNHAEQVSVLYKSTSSSGRISF